MPLLGELILEEGVTSAFASTVSVGGVYRMRFYPEHGIRPKNSGDSYRNKLFIVLGVDEGLIYGCLLINSEINIKALPIEAQEVQYPIMGHNYNGKFSKAISYVDCSEIKDIKVTQIYGADFICSLSREDLERILNTVCDGGLIPKAVLKRFKLI